MPQKRASIRYRNVSGKRSDLGGRFFRSKWEANLARWLNHLIECSVVNSWEYEPKEFVFAGERRGPGQFYRPDFLIKYEDGREEYWEVKAYLDAVSKTKLKRMKKHFPEKVVLVIDRGAYLSVEKDACRMIENWE